jgi:hypothetical protein
MLQPGNTVYRDHTSVLQATLHTSLSGYQFEPTSEIAAQAPTTLCVSGLQHRKQSPPQRQALPLFGGNSRTQRRKSIRLGWGSLGSTREYREALHTAKGMQQKRCASLCPMLALRSFRIDSDRFLSRKAVPSLARLDLQAVFLVFLNTLAELSTLVPFGRVF